jgi:N-acetyl-gamma-glutamyl-phosphate reductase
MRGMTTRIYIDGDQGTTGLQIRQRLQHRSDLQLLALPDALRKDPQARAEALNSCDIAILCLPDDAARDAVAMVRRTRRAPHRRQLGAPHGAGLDLRLCRTGAGPGGAHRRRHARHQPRLLPHRRAGPAAAAGRRRPAAGRPPGDHPRRVGYSGQGRARRRPPKAHGAAARRRSGSTAWRCSTSMCPRSGTTPACSSGRSSCRPTAPSARASC